MSTKLLRTLLFSVSIHLIFAQDEPLTQTTECGPDLGKGNFGGLLTCYVNPSTATQQPQPAAPLTQTTECGSNLGKGNFGGLLTCYVNPSTAIQQPQPTAPVGAVPTELGNLPEPGPIIPATVTVYPLTRTVTGQDGGLSTVMTSVSWTSSDIATSTTVDGQTKETTIPVWVCIGELCNPKCKQSEPCDTSEDGGIGPSGFPWPLAPIISPVQSLPSQGDGENGGGENGGGENGGGENNGGENDGGESDGGSEEDANEEDNDDNGVVGGAGGSKGGKGGKGGGGGGGGGGRDGGNDSKEDGENDEKSTETECATKTATFCVDKCSTISGSLSCSSTCTATSTGCDLTGTTTTTTETCSSQVCRTAVLTTIGGGPASSITICPDCDATATESAPESTPDPDALIFTLTFVTTIHVDTQPLEVDTAAAYLAIQSIGFEQLSFYPGGIMSVDPNETFPVPEGPLTTKKDSTDVLTEVPPLPSETQAPTSPEPTAAEPHLPGPCQSESDCPESECAPGQAVVCLPIGKCGCGGFSSLDLGPLGRRVQSTFVTQLRRD